MAQQARHDGYPVTESHLKSQTPEINSCRQRRGFRHRSIYDHADNLASNIAANSDGMYGALDLSSSLSTAFECSFLPGEEGSLQTTAFVDIGNGVRLITSALISAIWLDTCATTCSI